MKMEWLKPFWGLLSVGLVIVASSLACAAIIGSIGPWSYGVVFRRSASLIGIATILLYRTKIQRETIRSWGLVWSATSQWELLMGWALSVGWFMLVALPLLGTGAMRWQIDGSPSSLAVVFLWNLAAIGLVALIEEIIFRGFLLQELLRSSSTPWAVTLSACVYSLVHFIRPLAPSMGLLPQFIGLCLFGTVLAWGYLATRRLWFSIGLHWGAAYLTLIDKHVLEFVAQPCWWGVGGGKLYDSLWGWIGIILLIPVARRFLGASPIAHRCLPETVRGRQVDRDPVQWH